MFVKCARISNHHSFASLGPYPFKCQILELPHSRTHFVAWCNVLKNQTKVRGGEKKAKERSKRKKKKKEEKETKKKLLRLPWSISLQMPNIEASTFPYTFCCLA
jgi:hypothetical protein